MSYTTSARRTVGVLASAAALAAVAPAAADAASLTFDRACQLQTQMVTATLTGFSPNASVVLASTNSYGGTIYEIVSTDASGNGTVSFPSPVPQLDAPGSRELPFQATDAVDAGITAAGAFRTSTGTFTVSGRDRPTTAKRTWTMSGFQDGRTVYGHFVHRGKLRGTYAFGVARGVCGELVARAAAIPLKFKSIRVKGKKRKAKIPTGEWRVQLDHSKRYSPSASPRMIGTLTVSGSQRT
ncbi:hypothetical protein PAI11_39500 [Patulibacter medicamentivorans]|uniref:Uncharacterized protein n=1 Tax=Patulibacter medicamentivorans TaxID=1097667 RepID=H0EAS6_9ACTN|nr:hypothetical protein [Patulibacter medicamentivorans]EHN09251.1 hypothetical protein PAI11_39500 [Patulibacter medicamentivorans]